MPHLSHIIGHSARSNALCPGEVPGLEIPPLPKTRDKMKRNLILLSAVLFAVACSSSKVPLIGITCSRSASGATMLTTTYTDAISKAGGVPTVIPTVKTREEADALLASLDGIVFSGGEDVNPAWYGEEILNETVYMDSVRDHSDSLLARAALASGKPILAICRGAQLMNVILGGSLYQDIPTQIPGADSHGGGARNRIGLEEGCVLSRIYGPDSLEANSFHHQAVKVPAPGIRITAHSADGIVEAFETDQIWAFQFHPEKMLQDGEEKWLELFKEYVRRLYK